MCSALQKNYLRHLWTIMCKDPCKELTVAMAAWNPSAPPFLAQSVENRIGVQQQKWHMNVIKKRKLSPCQIIAQRLCALNFKDTRYESWIFWINFILHCLHPLPCTSFSFLIHLHNCGTTTIGKLLCHYLLWINGEFFFHLLQLLYSLCQLCSPSYPLSSLLAVNGCYIWLNSFQCIITFCSFKTKCKNGERALSNVKKE